jgi:hypothetical protein
MTPNRDLRLPLHYIVRQLPLLAWLWPCFLVQRNLIESAGDCLFPEGLLDYF